jgi:hypothetical protein
MLDENHGICTAATGPSPSTKMNCLYLEISQTVHYILCYFQYWVNNRNNYIFL